MKKSLFLIIPLVLLFISPVQAQILKNIARSATNSVKNSAEDRAQEEVDNQAKKSVNKFFDKLTESDSTKKENEEETQTGTSTSGTSGSSSSDGSSEGMSKFMKSLGVSTEDVKHKDSYKFNSQVITVTEMTDENGKKSDPTEYIMCFNESTNDVMFKMSGQSNSSTTIIDSENTCMLILTESEGKKTGLASKFDPNAKVSQPGDQKTEDESEPECEMTKTGNSKTINGFSCKEYICETADEITIVWVTKDFSASNNKMFKNSTFGANYKTEGFEGMVIQYEVRSKKDKSSTVMTTKSIDMNKPSSFSTAGYAISGFSFKPKN